MGYDTNYDRDYDGGTTSAARSGRPGQLGDPEHGYQLGDPEHGANEGYPPVGPTHPPTPARPAQLGDPEHGYQLGDPDHGANEGYPPATIGQQFAAEGVSVVLEDRDGRTYATATADRAYGAKSLDITLEANAVSDWTVTVPYAPSLERWGFATVHVGFDGERIYRGELRGVDTDETGSAETDLSGVGPLGRMQRGDVSRTFTRAEAPYLDEAIRVFLSAFAPDAIRFRVLTPADANRVPLPDSGDGDREFEGSPLKVFAELVGRAGMAWTVDHSGRDTLLEVFYPGLTREETPWRTIDLQRSLDLEGYNNHIVVEGALKGDGSGERYHGEAIDEWERRNITAPPPPPPIRQPDLVSDADCRARAKTELGKALGERTLSASATTTPAIVSAPPGYHYRLRELEGAGITDEGAARLPLSKTSYTESAGEAKTSLSFEDSSPSEDLIRDLVRDGLEADIGGLKRKPVAMAAATAEPSIEAWGDAEWGAGAWGGR